MRAKVPSVMMAGMGWYRREQSVMMAGMGWYESKGF